ncbi:MAG: cyclopropane fatty acyl phospholipid synthase [Acidobacteriia bacterium]|nr:cyclopropane fatty acyl phospholipid synthase [Terriglobia bacterium]
MGDRHTLVSEGLEAHLFRGAITPETKRKTRTREVLALADIRINGDRPWDIAVHDDRFYLAVPQRGSLGMGESYMDAWWDCPELDQMFCRIFTADLERQVPFGWELALSYLKAFFLNLQIKARASGNVHRHYDIGNDLYARMLDRRMVYSCANWERASSLDEAQENNLHFVCRKLHLRPNSELLDIGCGWGSFAKFAAENYGAKVLGITLSGEQLQLARQNCTGLPVEIRLQDYRDVRGQFDHIVSLGMFEHVGYKNYRTYMEIVHRCLKKDGLFVLGTIGTNLSTRSMDPWMDKYIFPNALLPSMKQIGASIDGLFIVEELQNWGPYYDRTLMAWFRNFQEHWGALASRYGERFYRMWKYYLLASAGYFRSRRIQRWQFLLAPTGPSAT